MLFSTRMSILHVLELSHRVHIFLTMIGILQTNVDGFSPVGVKQIIIEGLNFLLTVHQGTMPLFLFVMYSCNNVCGLLVFVVLSFL